MTACGTTKLTFIIPKHFLAPKDILQRSMDLKVVIQAYSVLGALDIVIWTFDWRSLHLSMLQRKCLAALEAVNQVLRTAFVYAICASIAAITVIYKCRHTF